METFFSDRMYFLTDNTCFRKLILFVTARITGSAVKLIVTLALLQLLTACMARSPIVSAKARRAGELFKLHCATAGETIKRTVSDVDGIFLLKGRSDKINFSEQFLMDDPYGSDLGGNGYIESFLKARHELGRRYAALLKEESLRDPAEPIGYDYVEMSDADNGTQYRYTAYVDQPGKTDLKFALNYSRVILQKTPSTGQKPRYGVTYDDISTLEDRVHWIAGSSLKVIDLRTNEVIAERIGYMIDGGQGDTAGGRSPWLLAASVACPAFPGRHAYQNGQAARFVEKVLMPIRYREIQPQMSAFSLRTACQALGLSNGRLMSISNAGWIKSRTAALGPGCVKTQKLEIFMGRVTLPGPEKIHSGRFDRSFFCPWTFFTFLHSLGR